MVITGSSRVYGSYAPFHHHSAIYFTAQKFSRTPWHVGSLVFHKHFYFFTFLKFCKLTFSALLQQTKSFRKFFEISSESTLISLTACVKMLRIHCLEFSLIFKGKFQVSRHALQTRQLKLKVCYNTVRTKRNNFAKLD